jgi:prepilin-type N-terminal cleavage/methylation domain-containing protein
MSIKNKGFTLIELLVVISIIALLSSVVMSSLASARDRARTAKALAEMSQFAKAVSIAQGESSKTLLTITGSGCSDCSECRTGINLKGTSGVCYTSWINVITTVQANTNGNVVGLTNMTRDPWGSPYTVDENQGEGGAGACSSLDSFRSVGPDGIWGNSDDITSITLPLSAKCP